MQLWRAFLWRACTVPCQRSYPSSYATAVWALKKLHGSGMQVDIELMHICWVWGNSLREHHKLHSSQQDACTWQLSKLQALPSSTRSPAQIMAQDPVTSSEVLVTSCHTSSMGAWYVKAVGTRSVMSYVFQ